MGLGIFAVILVISLAAGVAVQVLGKRKSPYDFLIVGVTAAYGAVFASNIFPTSNVFAALKDGGFGPSIDGFYVIPGVAFAFIIATMAYIGTRDTYAPDAASA